MKKTVPAAVEGGRVRAGHFASDERFGLTGMFILDPPDNESVLQVIASDGMGWDHVSVSVYEEERCPTWEEMDWVKRLFWDDNEHVVQFHINNGLKVNNHAYCLHLWRKQGKNPHVPPPELVGIPDKD